MANWDDLKCLMHLAKGKTMTNASIALRTNVSTVSRRLERLNSELASPVLLKQGNGWDLTAYGRRLAEASLEFQLQMDRLEAETLEAASGKMVARSIILCAPDILISRYLSRYVGEFSEAYPGIDLSIISDSANGSVADGTIDVSLMVERPTKGRMVCRKAGTIQTGIFAKKGTAPTKWIGLDRSMDHLPEMKAAFEYFETGPELRMSTMVGIRRTMENTNWAGIGTRILFPETDDYVILGGDNALHDREIWLGFHETRRHDNAIREVCEWIVDIFKKEERLSAKPDIKSEPLGDLFQQS